jgi:hypothetical protein
MTRVIGNERSDPEISLSLSGSMKSVCIRDRGDEFEQGTGLLTRKVEANFWDWTNPCPPPFGRPVGDGKIVEVRRVLPA